MRRGSRKLWRDLAAAATKVAESKNYAEEYLGGVEVVNALEAIRVQGQKQLARDKAMQTQERLQ